MQFSDITSSVGQAWNFTWPPIVVLTLMVVFAWVASPAKLKSIRARLAGASVGQRATVAKAMLEPYGLGKLIPIAIVFLIVFILYATNIMVGTLGRLIPPEVGYRPDVLSARALGEERVACLMGDYPSSLDMWQLISILRMKADSSAEVKSQAASLNERSVVALRRFHVAKFLLVWLLLCLALEHRKKRERKWRRVTFVGLTLLCWLFFQLIAYLYATQQRELIKTRYTAALLLQGKSCIDEKGQRLRLDPRHHRQFNSIRKTPSWWEFNLPLVDYGRWVYQNLL